MQGKYSKPKVLCEIQQNFGDCQHENESSKINYFQNSGSNIRLQSIYTEGTVSQEYEPPRTLQSEYSGEDDDIYAFLQRQKTLRERIENRLSKKKGYTNQNEATFNPKFSKQLNKITLIKLKDVTKRREKTVEKRQKYYNIGNKENNKSQYSQLDFHARQRKTLENKQKLRQRLKTQNSKNELKECTFKPKLTKYNKYRKS